MTEIDRAESVREGEALDEGRLGDWLVEHVGEFEGSEPEVRQFRAGHSNLTYLLVDESGAEYVLRRPPHGAHVESGHDMSREWQVLEALEGVYEKVPRPLARCDDDSVIGAPFYVMERVRGVILRGGSPDVEGLGAETMGELSEAFVREFVELHDFEYERAGLEGFGRPDGYVDRQIDGWIRRYRDSQTDEIDGMSTASTWLREHKPESSGASLIHNDFKFDNFVLDPDDLTSVVAVLDWEMATIGDPLMDLGTSLAYWVEPDDSEVLKSLDVSPTAAPGTYSRREVVERYEEESGRDCSEILFYYVYGLYKVAVIGQQIYYRYDQGHTDDPRFGMLIHAVRALADEAERAIRDESID